MRPEAAQSERIKKLNKEPWTMERRLKAAERLRNNNPRSRTGVDNVL